MPDQPHDRVELAPEIESVLARYVEIQEEMSRLQEEKSRLQETLRLHVAGMPDGYWGTHVRGRDLKISHRRVTEVEYDEDLLRRRLGDRYTMVLSPDPKRIRRHIAEARELLLPILDKVGVPDRDQVQRAVESGSVNVAEFQGAFTKRSTVRVCVMRVRSASASASDAGSATAGHGGDGP